MAKFSQTRQALVVMFMACGLAMPTLAYAQHHGGGGGGGARGGGRAPSHAASAPRSTGGSAPATSSGSTASAPNATTSTGRNNPNGNAPVGTAGPRMNTTTGAPGPVFGPWGRFIPWYSTGFGYGVGLVYNPYFGYGYGGLGYGYGGFYGGMAYGPWYDPFFYDPFSPFGYGYGGLGYGYTGLGYGDYYGLPPSADVAAGQAPTTTHITGSIRLKVSPDTAQVYVDGVLAGTASEFDGLVGHHLTLEAGSHQLELRADGYDSYKETITVDAGKTLTDRVSLKKSGK